MIISRSIHDAEGALVLSCPEGLIKRQWSYPVTISTVQIQNPGTEKLWWGLLLRCTVLRIQLKWLGVEAQIQSLAQCSGLKDNWRGNKKLLEERGRQTVCVSAPAAHVNALGY